MPFGARSVQPRRSDLIRQQVEEALFADHGNELSIDHRGLQTSRLQESYNMAFGKHVAVGVGFQVVRIHQIDEIGETFTLDFDMHVTWKDPSLVDVKEPDWDKAWSPTIIFRNQISAEVISRRIFVSDPRKGEVFCYLKYSATLYEVLELNYFPFDRQTLHIDISSIRPTTELRFEQFSGRRNKMYAMPISMWDIQTVAKDGSIRSVRQAKTSGEGDVAYDVRDIVVTADEELHAAADGLTYPLARFEILIERQCEWYLWNVIVVTFALVMLSAVIFVCSREDVPDKMSINVTLVLTIMAFKYTFSGDLPKKAYLTWMDKYLIAAFGVLVLQAITIWLAAVVPVDSHLLPVVEVFFPSAYYGIWILYHLRLLLLTSYPGYLYPSWDQVRADQREQVII
jgi:uncharacterized protein YhhL (DUF1145 family)